MRFNISPPKGSHTRAHEISLLCGLIIFSQYMSLRTTSNTQSRLEISIALSISPLLRSLPQLVCPLHPPLLLCHLSIISLISPPPPLLHLAFCSLFFVISTSLSFFFDISIGFFFACFCGARYAYDTSADHMLFTCTVL